MLVLSNSPYKRDMDITDAGLVNLAGRRQSLASLGWGGGGGYGCRIRGEHKGMVHEIFCVVSSISTFGLRTMTHVFAYELLPQQLMCYHML